MTEPRPESKEFFYNAGALALGGQIVRPCCETIEPQAAAVLPVVGGHGHAHVDKFRFHDAISFHSASSTVVGSQSGGEGDEAIFNTLAMVVIEGLDIGGILTADRVVARLVSEYSFADGELGIHPVGTSFENLRLVGVEIRPRLHEVLFDCGTLLEIERGCRKGPNSPLDFRGKPLTIAKLTAQKPHVLTALYERPDKLPTGCSADGPWGIKIEGFGTVYLGELVLSHGERRLTMIRVKMGSPVRGDMAFATVGGNGTTHP